MSLLARGTARSDQWAALAICVCAGLLGAAAAAEPLVAVFPIAVLLGAAIVSSGRARAVFVVFGGLLTLQSSQSVTVPKLAYLAGCLLCVGVAAQQSHARRDFDPDLGRIPRLTPWLFGMLTLAIAVGLAGETTFADATRDAAPYLLTFAAPLLALDVARSLRAVELERMFLLAGGLATLAFMFQWMESHQVASTGIERLVLPSFFFAAALFTYATAKALTGGRHRALWLVTAAAIFALLLLTGTRSTLVLVAAPLAMAFTPGIASTRTILRVVGCTVIAVIVAIFVVQGLGRLTGADIGAAAARFSTLPSVFASPVDDPSFLDRREQHRSAVAAFKSAPLAGVGLGYRFELAGPSGRVRSGYTIDSAVAIPAKVGLVGSGVLIVFLISISGAAVGRVRRERTAAPEALALWGSMVITAIWLLLSSPFEDKGFGFGLVFLLA